MPRSIVRPASVEEVIHGVAVRDPYRWLEDRALPETETWIAEQKRRCEDYFANCGDLQGIRQRVRKYLDREVVDQPAKVRDRYFYRRRDRGQEQACIHVRNSATGSERILVDPSADGPFTSVGIHCISDDGSLLAYESREGGEDRKALCFVDVVTGRTLPDRIVTGYASGLEFALDNRGYFYCHETSMVLEEHRVLFHLFGKPGDDQVVFRRARSCESRMSLTADTMHLGVIWMHGEGDVRLMDFWIARRDEPKIWRQVFADKSLPFSPILKFGRIFALSYVDAPNGRLVELSEDGQQDRELIPEQKTRIRQLVISANRIYTMHFDHPVSSIRNWSLSGTALGEIGVTDEGTIQLLPGRRDDGGLFYTYESFTEPCIIFERMPDSAQSRVWHRCSLPFERKPIQVRHVSYLSGDSVQIPMTLVAMGDPEEARSAPVVMTSYGGFGVPTTPQFSVLATILIEAGAILALPHIRGGCEFGEAWHKAARGAKRQVSFDDFTAAAQRLCDTGITSPDRLAIFGGSNSGLLVGAAMTQRPELFRAVLSIAPLLDMVRYEHFDRAIRWRREYGTVENPDDFRALHQYSPYHCIEKDCDYPATMFVSGDKDDRCNPAHVRKMAARLQERSSQTSPVIVDYSEQRGHAPALPLSTRVDALARRIAFLCKELNISMDTGGNHEATCD